MNIHKITIGGRLISQNFSVFYISGSGGSKKNQEQIKGVGGLSKDFQEPHQGAY